MMGGMIWSNEQVRAVSNCFIQLRVDISFSADALTHIQRQMFEKLQHDVEKYGCRIHPGDLKFTEELDHEQGILKVQGWWAPTTNQVEIRRGYRDGDVFAVPAEVLASGGSIRVVSQPDLRDLDGTETAPIPTVHLDYEREGWHETERRWVYGLAS